ncbi:MAG: SRPBCC family protein [Stackebrandtia sp.]
MAHFAKCHSRMSAGFVSRWSHPHSPGFVAGTRLAAPDVRVVGFANGDVAHERMIAHDPDARRIVWEFFDGWARPDHNNASMHVVAQDDGRSRLQWIHDVLPADLAVPIGAAMDGGLEAIKATIERG